MLNLIQSLLLKLFVIKISCLFKQLSMECFLQTIETSFSFTLNKRTNAGLLTKRQRDNTSTKRPHDSVFPKVRQKKFALFGSLRWHDGDGNENVKNSEKKNSSLHVHYAFLHISLPSLTNNLR